MRPSTISVRSASTHNLQGVDVDLPCGKLIAVCGVSGSGKSSLAVDTLYAEGQRRYVETLSPYARQFLEQLQRPDVERIDGLPPPIRVQEAGRTAGWRMTVGTATDIHDLLAILFAEQGEIVCPDCQRTVRRDLVENAARLVESLPEGARLLIAFPMDSMGVADTNSLLKDLQSLGFRRIVTRGKLLEVGPQTAADLDGAEASAACDVIVDRLVAGRTEESRLVESLESAREHGVGRYVLYVELSTEVERRLDGHLTTAVSIDERPMLRCPLCDDYVCGGCGRAFAEPTPALLSYQSPVGACPACEGLGRTARPDQGASARRGSKKWRICPTCEGRRLRPEALAVQVRGRSIAAAAALSADELVRFLQDQRGGDDGETPESPVEAQIRRRLETLADLGIGHLPLARPLRELGRGERQRVAMAFAVSSSLSNALYVLDEPTVGLHAADLASAVQALKRLRDRGNTVLAVDHDAQVIRSADVTVELGPGAGAEGGGLVFCGTPAELVATEGSKTGDWLAGRRGRLDIDRRRPANHGNLRLIGARAKNLQGVTVEFPLGVLCVVTGVSGAGKTALVEQTLYPALREALGGDAVDAQTWDDLQGGGQIDRVELVTQSPPARSIRSNPVTYVKAFDAIRGVFAETIDATTRNYGPGFFSFNVEGGRCERCKGEGRLTVDMQFLPDVVMVCPECNGRRYRAEALAVKHRGRSIADVLEMTVREATTFFRGQQAVQAKLACLKDIGLDYIRLGQPIRTLSGGEVQRLKLASLMQAKRTGRTLLLLDEPTAGLHAIDVFKLFDCFDALLAVGHSIVAATHSLQLVRAADYMIDLGPGAGEQGGRVVAVGTPEEVAENSDSITGRYLREAK